MNGSRISEKGTLTELCLLFAVALCAFCLMSWSSCDTAYASSTQTVHVQVTYKQSQARGMLSSINNFRTGNNAWYWNSNNRSKTKCKHLRKLKYDYKLEKVAMLRAKEIALSYSHVRPNGKSCFTAYKAAGAKSYSAKGENIAFGQTSAKEVFTAWREDNENYAGQGHRRNMLDSDFNAVGIAHVKYQGTDYWVQEFGYVKSPKTKKTAAKNSTSVQSVKVLSRNVKKVSVKVNTSSLSMAKGSTRKVPKTTVKAKIKNYRSSKWLSTCTLVPDSVKRSSSNKHVAKVAGSVVKGVSNGSAKLTITTKCNKKKYKSSIPVKVSGSVSDATFTLSSTSYVYDGSAKKPTIKKAKLGSTTLTKGKDYVVVGYKNNVNAGTASIVIKGKGSYTGTKTINYTIHRASLNSGSWLVGGISNTVTRKYNGQVQTVYPTIYNRYNRSVRLTRDNDFKVDFNGKSPKNVGTYVYEIKGIGNYYGTMNLGTLKLKIVNA